MKMFVTTTTAGKKPGKYPWGISVGETTTFRKLTNNSTVIMDEETWAAIGKRPLVGRVNIIVSDTLIVDRATILRNCDLRTDVAVIKTIDEIKARYSAADNVFVIGGRELCTALLDLIDEIHITTIVIPGELLDGLDIDIKELSSLYLPERGVVDNGLITADNGVVYQELYSVLKRPVPDDGFDQYESTKSIHAKPATGGEYIAARKEAQLGAVKSGGWSEHNPERTQDGYHVIYQKGTSREYHSWSPTDVFAESSRKIEI